MWQWGILTFIDFVIPRRMLKPRAMASSKILTQGERKREQGSRGKTTKERKLRK